MNSRERRVIHLALRGETALRSESSGSGPQRQVVVYPAGMASLPELPYVPEPRRHGRRWRRGPRSAPAMAHAVDGGAALSRAPALASHLQLQDTIVAISTPPGRGGLGVVRLSGHRARGHRGSHPAALRRSAVALLARAHGRTAGCRRPRGGPGGGRPSSKRRAPTPPKTWSRSPATARPWSCAMRWSGLWRPARGWPSPASSPCAPS